VEAAVSAAMGLDFAGDTSASRTDSSVASLPLQR